MEKVNCNLCGSNNFNLLFKNYDRLHKKPGVFNVVKCKNCGLVFLNPRPRDISAYYPDDYSPYNLPRATFPEFLTSKFLNSEKYYKKNKNALECFFAYVFELIYSPVPFRYFGKALDVGCGRGTGLYSLKNAGWDVYGFDTSKKAVEFARKKLGLKNIFMGTLENRKYPENFFDVIILSHVIEHLPDPVKTLNKIKKILRPGGLLLITTPNFGSFGAKIFGQYWYPVDSPRHLFLLDKETLKKMLNKVGGFEVKKINYSIAVDSFTKSIEYYWSEKIKSSISLPFLKIFFLPFTIILGFLRRSDVFSWYIEKTR